MTSEPVSGITSDDPDVTRILAAMSAQAATAPPPPSPPPPSPPPPSPPLQPPPPPAPPEWSGPSGGWTGAPGGWAGAPGGPIVVDADEPAQLVRGYQPPPTAALPDQRTAAATDVVTCPECGQLATVNMARRSADDFCRNCDFPLFWAKGTVITPEGQETRASLRRLPGTVGRAATAALICPHCAEPNSPTAEICVRCALSLHPVDIPEPEPEPLIAFAPPPEPAPLPEPAPRFDWWWVVAVVMAVLAVALIVVLLILQ